MISCAFQGSWCVFPTQRFGSSFPGWWWAGWVWFGPICLFLESVSTKERIGIMHVVIAIFAAFVPTIIYSLLLWWLDRYEKEPLGLIVAAFLWGALPAIGLALMLEVVLAAPFARPLVSWVVVPVVEEFVKGLALIGLFLFARGEIDGALDGIVYGSLIGFGFSMTENVIDFIRFAPDLMAHFWVRSVLLGLNHAFFTSLTGLALGVVRYERSRMFRVFAFVVGLMLATLFHSVHNVVSRYATAGLFLSWLIESGGVAVVVAIMVLAWRHERLWMERELGAEVQDGVLSPTEYAEVLSSLRRMHVQFNALLTGGWGRCRQVRRFHHLATELAFCKSHLHLDDQFCNRARCLYLRHEIALLRATLSSSATLPGRS